MQRAYQGSSEGGNCGQQYNQGYQQSNAGPSTDEVDWDFNWFFFLYLNLKLVFIVVNKILFFSWW